MLKVHAENFRSFPVLDWEIPSGLTLIDGVNKDTGGSNMAGKSTLLDAWFWCRYGWIPRWKGSKGGPADAVLRRKSGQIVGSTVVRVTEQFGNDVLEIQRSRPNRLVVWRNGIEQKGFDQKALEALVGSPDRFLICVYLPQKRQRSFYWMGDTDRTELISVVAGLEDLERAAVDAKLLRDEAKDHIEKSELTIQIHEERLRELPSRISDLTIKRDQASKQLQVAKDHVHKAEMRWDEYSYEAEQKSKDELDAKLEPMMNELWNFQADIGSLEREYLEKKEQLNHLPSVDPRFQTALDEAKKRLKIAEELTQQIGQIQSQIILETSLENEAKEGICSQCDQPLPEDLREEKARGHRARIKQLREALARIDVPEMGGIKRDIEQAEKAFLNARAQNDSEPSRLRAFLSELQAKIQAKKTEEKFLQREIQTAKEQSSKALADKKAELRRDVDLADRELSHYQRALKTAQETLDLIQNDEIVLRTSIADEDSVLRQWKKKLDQSLDLVEIFGPKGYRSVCFDGLIEKISDRSGQLLSILTQGLYSTRLDQVGQDSKGNQKIILRPVIIKGGSEVPADDLSGGAEERVALAYDVAIAETAGEGLPLLLDEVLSALDAVGKTEAMALLEEVSRSRPVLVIDHASEFKAMFSQVVRVVYENEESRLEVA